MATEADRIPITVSVSLARHAPAREGDAPHRLSPGVGSTTAFLPVRDPRHLPVTSAPVDGDAPARRWRGRERLCMLDGLGFPLSGPARSRRRGKAVPTARQWRQYDRDKADATLLRRAATFLREDPGRALDAGLACDEDAVALTALLDLLAAEIAHLDAGVRSQAVKSCRVLLGETMANPRIRQTRRR
jgi:hypothetical protein